MIRAYLSAVLVLLGATVAGAAHADETIRLDPNSPSHAFPHYWERMFGSGRAALSLRDSYRQDLRAVKAVTGVEYVRFHAIFHDELGVYREDKHGTALYNFTYVDQIYDGLLALGVRPMVELSFMPSALASARKIQSFWYAPNVAPPKDYARWDALISAFARHLVERYGVDEVSQWYFEVWNEPNLDFWAGRPTQSTYWTLYEHTARALKAVDQRLRVGGPATAQAAWIPDFIAYTAAHDVPVDFVSTHVYGNDTPENVFHSHTPVSREHFVCSAVRKVHEEIRASARPSLPLIWSEFNASYKSEPSVTDSAFMGPWLAETARECDGLVDAMSYWTFSDVFEEQGVIKTPFFGGFGLLAVGGIPKPAFNAFALLHRLGEQRLALDAEGALLTRRSDGTLVLALWNYAPPDGTAEVRNLDVVLPNATTAEVIEIDAVHGDPASAYQALGAPRYPNAAELATLKAAAALPAPVRYALRDGHLALGIPAHGLALITYK